MSYHCPRPPKQRAFDTSLLMWRRRFLSGTAFSPASLFASGEDGGWYDPSDLTSMYVGRTGESNTGTGNNPSVGSVVGVVLDKSQMGGQTAASFIAGQPELVTNGTFDVDATGWTATGDLTLTVSSGSLRMTRATNTNQYAYQQITSLTSGQFYLLEFEFVGESETSTEYLDVRVGSTQGGLDYGRANLIDGNANAGTYRLLFRTTTTSAFVNFYIRNGASGSWIEIDNISAKEIPGNHLVAPSDAARPLLQTEGGRYYLDFDGVDDYLLNTGLSITGATTMAMGANVTNASGTKSVFEISAASRGDTIGYIYQTTTNVPLSVLGAAFASQALISAVGSTGSSRVFVAQLKTDDFEYFRDGSSLGTDTSGTWPVNTATHVSLGGTTAGTPAQFSDVHMYQGFFIDRELTDVERENLEIYLANKSGATLAA